LPVNIFLSAVSDEFLAYRDQLRTDLTRHNVEVKVQGDFKDTGGTTLDKPLDWATTQNNLGSALRVIGERESGTSRLEEAVAAYRAALQERPRERVPLNWAMSFGSQGVAMMHLAERLKDAAIAETACRQIETALETMCAAGHAPFTAYYESRLPEARTVRDALKARQA
jgi:hypothetical protein